MDEKGDRGFFNIEGAAEFLKCSEKDVLHLVREKKIPHSVLPFGKILFDPERLRDWVLSFEQMPNYRKEEKTTEKSNKTSIRKEICQRFNCVARERSKYTNLYLGQQVYAQLHPSASGDGVDLSLRERGDDDNLPKCKVLKRIEIGDYIANFEKIKDAVGWKPKVSLEEGLQSSFDYYEKHKEHYW